MSAADLQGALLDGAQLQGAILIGAELQGALLTNANILGASLDEAALQGASLDSADLRGASLANANLQGASLSDAQLQGASLPQAQLQGASLDGAYLQGASLRGAYLQGASLRAELQGASFNGAQLQGAWLPPGVDIPDILGTLFPKISVDKATYAKALAGSLGGLVCDGDSNAIFILRGLLRNYRIKATGAEAAKLAERIQGKDCPVSAVLTEDDRAKLRAVVKVAAPTPAPAWKK